MERLSIRKNVLLGFTLLNFIQAIVLLATEKDLTQDAKKICVASCVFAAFSVALGIIPFIGWIAEIVLMVFYIIAIVQVFKGNFECNVPVIGGIIDHFANK